MCSVRRVYDAEHAHSQRPLERIEAGHVRVHARGRQPASHVTGDHNDGGLSSYQRHFDVQLALLLEAQLAAQLNVALKRLAWCGVRCMCAEHTMLLTTKHADDVKAARGDGCVGEGALW